MEMDSWRKVLISAEAIVFILFAASLIYQGRTFEGLVICPFLLAMLILWHRKWLLA